MRILKTLAALLAVSIFSFAQAGNKITIAAAPSLKNALTEVADTFKKANPGEEIEIAYTVSGKAVAQIQQGLPVDIFCAADMDFPQKLVESGHAIAPVRPFALGRLVLWSSTLSEKELTFQGLTTNPAIQKVAIANPKLAPYGMRSVEALKASGVYDAIQPKLVFGESISATAQYALSGTVQVGFVALSLATASDMKGKGNYVLVPDNLHQPLAQGYVILKRGVDNPLAKQFGDYIISKPAQAIFQKYGFTSPTK